MCSPLAGLSVSCYFRLAPPEVDCVEDVYVVIICWPVSTAEYYKLLAYSRAGHGS